MPGERRAVENRQIHDIAERLWLASKLKVLSPRRTFSMNDAVDVALFLTDKLFKSAGITVQRMLGPELPDVDAGMGQIEQALVNLLLNACEATGRGGIIAVTTTRSDGGRTVELVIADTGVGMPEEVLERAFEPFYSTKGRLGIGLTAAQEMVSGCGGDIRLESTMGQGTKAIMRIRAAAG